MSTISVEAVPTKPLSSLAPGTPIYVKTIESPVQYQSVATPVTIVETTNVKTVVVDDGSSSYASYSWGSILFTFLLVFFISFFLLYVFDPVRVQNTGADGNPNGTPNAGKCVVGAIILGVFFALIFWALCSFLKC
jgi:hypothetical protein